jgi:octaprenyl-diphosphate synthase
MLSIDEIQRPIASDLALFEEKFKSQMRSKVMLLDKITSYIVKQKGKQIRPIFVFHAALFCGGITESTHRGAALIELLHTATLVHDDVVDESYYRRGLFSINALWKNKIAVLVGDYLLSRGLLLSVEHKEFRLLEIVSKAVQEMSEGELLQIEKARRLDITEEIYFEIIRQKTASLIASCCEVGAASAGVADDVQLKMREFGMLAGIAFQIKDDLFDYGAEEVGKPLGIDIKEKKMTLPLIFALQKADWWQKRTIIYQIKNQSHKAKVVKEVIEFVKQSGGLEYAEEMMLSYKDKALAVLESIDLPGDRAYLKSIIEFAISRKK